MTWGKPTKKGWSKIKDEVEESIRNVIYTVMDVVSGGAIRANKTSYSDDTHVGFWLGVDGVDNVAKFNLGGPSYYLKWNGTRLEISGSLRTKNGYVQVIDESSEDFGEGVRLLIEDYLTSGALRWDDAAGVMGAALVASRNGTSSTYLAVRVYPRAVGAQAQMTLAAYDAPYGSSGNTARITVGSNGVITLLGNLDCSQRMDDVGLLIRLVNSYRSSALYIMDEDEDQKFSVSYDGLAYAKGGFMAYGQAFVTPEGGYAVRVVAGEALSRGNVVYVKIGSGADGKVWKTVYTDGEAIQMPVGIAYADAVANAGTWIVTSGIAYALPESGVTAARGNVAIVSNAESGRLEQSATTPTTEHWRECGHWLDTGASAGALARLLVHFN